MTNIPVHVGLILDGNRRWAKSRGLPTLDGHRQGYENLKAIGDHLLKSQIKYISAYVWSAENWQRSQEEIDYLMNLTLWVLQEEVDEFHAKNIRLKFVGSPHNVRTEITNGVQAAEQKTANNTAGTLALCFNYSGQQEVVDAVKSMVSSGADLQAITTKSLTRHLYAPEVPPIDLMVRTAGEQRISGFMLWRVSYAELYFSDKYWPDFTTEDMDEALKWYAKRERRFGGNGTAQQTQTTKPRTVVS